jgi:hypothetical protein
LDFFFGCLVRVMMMMNVMVLSATNSPRKKWWFDSVDSRSPKSCRFRIHDKLRMNRLGPILLLSL